MPGSRALKLCFYSFTLAQIISILGDRLHQFSVVGMIGRINPGDPLELFQLGLFSYVPVLVFAPLFGGIIDRISKASLLVVVDAIRGVIVLFIPALFDAMGNLYAFYIPVFVLSLANLWFSPTKSAIVPEVFGEKHLLQINAILWGTGIVGTFAGFLLGGWLFDFHSWRLSFYSDGVSYLISVVFLLPLLWIARRGERPSPGGGDAPRETPPARTVGLLASVRDGLSLIRGNRPVTFGLAVQTSLFASLGILYVIGLARVQSVLPAGKTIYLSVIASSGTLGLLAGSGLGIVMRRRLSVSPMVACSTVLFALTWIGVARTESFVPIIVWAFIMGVSMSPIFILTETLLQVETPRQFRGRVFSAREVLTRFSFLVTISIATLATAFISKELIMTCVGVVLAVSGVLLLSRNFLKA